MLELKNLNITGNKLEVICLDKESGKEKVEFDVDLKQFLDGEEDLEHSVFSDGMGFGLFLDDEDEEIQEIQEGTPVNEEFMANFGFDVSDILVDALEDNGITVNVVGYDEEEDERDRKSYYIGDLLIEAICKAFNIDDTGHKKATCQDTDELREVATNPAKNISEDVNIGDTVYFGSYMQSNSHEKEPVEWRVLDKKDKKLLVISEKGLDCKQYHYKDKKVRWETCSLRGWLNDDFLKDAFNVKEQSMISDTIVSADKNHKYDMNPGNETTDKVFLLSIKEAEKYFEGDESRKCASTGYAKKQGAWEWNIYKTASGEYSCSWWLRSPGNDRFNVAGVVDGGAVYYDGFFGVFNTYAVRPALWINLES